MSAARERISLDEYLALEEAAVTKSEYFDGEIFAMAGGTPEHSAIATAALIHLGVQLRGRGCKLFNSDLRVRISNTGLITYPDITVVCGPPTYDARDRNALTNPTLIVEVLSEGTEAYDRGEKFAHYQQLPSLKEYVLISWDRHRIEMLTRIPDRDAWEHTECSDPNGALLLSSIDCRLALAEVYADIEFPARTGNRHGSRGLRSTGNDF